MMSKHDSDLEYVCSNSNNRHSKKIFQDLTPEDILTRNNPFMNRASTTVDENRAVTVLGDVPEVKETESLIEN
jgi:hypothetical protein